MQRCKQEGGAEAEPCFLSNQGDRTDEERNTRNESYVSIAEVVTDTTILVGKTMPQEIGPWVVYLMTLRKGAAPMRAVCEQAEWNAMELGRPGYHQLIRGNIGSEREAELLARGTSGNRSTTHPRRL
jgi:hypothetical protein